MSPAPTRPRAAPRWPPAVAPAAALLATLLVLMFAGHHATASGGHHATGCAHAAETGGPSGALGGASTPEPDTPTHHAHVSPGDCAGDCGVLLICTLLLAAVPLAAGLASRRAGSRRPLRLRWARIPLPASLRHAPPSPDLVALGISRT
ncbi:hypothetical protein [Myceligenerans indicum]|uniref:DUF2946 domain-containing protein n=1 Tax=Myceligenerans indicum TaxID=2593663 RepID=A0ABS1LKN5_9MICO|nr:hypothetical protein [Myceligenerans indicum]MBL0886820.1 hypothetical protein [Myceligenerans indicum]